MPSYGIKADVENLDFDKQTQICRCTRNQPSQGSNPRNDWVWVKQSPERWCTTWVASVAVTAAIYAEYLIIPEIILITGLHLQIQLYSKILEN
jgi:hypothetical protein